MDSESMANPLRPKTAPTRMAPGSFEGKRTRISGFHAANVAKPALSCDEAAGKSENILRAPRLSIQ